MKRLVNTSELTREEWLEYRTGGIGGSDAGAICGMNPWKSAIDVYMDKTATEVKETEESESMRLGKDLEAYVASRWEEATGKKVRRNNFMLQHDDYPWMIADIDREVVGESAVLECKTASPYASEQWANGETPQHYVVQCLHYLAVTGADRCYLCCLIWGKGLQFRTIERNEGAIAALIQLEESFWKNNVEAKVMPAPDGSDAADEAIKELYPEGDPEEESVDLTGKEKIEKRLARYDELNSLMKSVSEEKAQIEQELKLEMKTAEKAFVGARKITWKTAKGRKGFDTKALAEEHPDIYEKYVTQGPSYRIFKIGKPIVEGE